MHRIVAILLACLLGLVIAGCENSSTSTGAKIAREELTKLKGKTCENIEQRLGKPSVVKHFGKSTGLDYDETWVYSGRIALEPGDLLIKFDHGVVLDVEVTAQGEKPW